MDWLTSRIDFQNIGGFSSVLQNPSGLFGILALVVIVLYSLSIGKTKAIVSLLSIYVAYVLTLLFPFSDWLKENVTVPGGAPILNALIFGALYIATFILLARAMKSRLDTGSTPILKVILVSIIQLGLILSIVLSLLPPEFGADRFGPVYPYVASTLALWLWAASSLVIMPFMKGSRR